METNEERNTDMEKLKILMIAGDWTDGGEKSRPSGIMQKIAAEILSCKDKIESFNFKNGGNYNELADIYRNQMSDYNVVFWFPNIDNKLPKIITMDDIKQKYPKIMLITSKNNRSGKYGFEELIQRALVSKSNLMIEIANTDNFLCCFRLFDPLMNVFYEGADIKMLTKTLMKRLMYLRSITRQKTYQTTDDKSLILKWYFDQFTEEFDQSDRKIDVPDMPEFIDLVHKYADIFSQLMPHSCNQERFIGNCSVKSSPVIGRCSKSMPSFKKDGMIFVSKRNIDKSQIQMEHFVPVFMQNGRIKYCGNDKPSVDTPVQIRLYDALPEIRFMIHSHCYIKNTVTDAYMTDTVNPCGAVEEADEILKLIDERYGGRNNKHYFINLKGHGSIIMGHDIESLKNIEFISRPSPEYV